MRSVFAALAVMCGAACTSGSDLTPNSGVPVDTKTLTYKDHTFKAGDAVRIKSTAGTFKPKDTGNVIDIRAEVGRTEGDVAAHTLLAADIKRFLERPTADLQKVIPASAAPPGAPIGDLPQEWLARPPYKQ